MTRLSVMLILSSLSLVSFTEPFSGAAARQKLLNIGACPGCNLRSTDLRGQVLMEANLANANLSDALLENANLRGAKLYGAILLNVDLSSTKLAGANLEGGAL